MASVIQQGERFYLTADGVWTQKDPVSQPFSIGQANGYSFAAGDPVNGIDPRGTIPFDKDVAFGCWVNGAANVGKGPWGAVGACGASIGGSVLDYTGHSTLSEAIDFAGYTRSAYKFGRKAIDEAPKFFGL